MAREEINVGFGWPLWVSISVGVGFALIVLAVICMAGESRYRSCIAEAEAKYPAQPVSAFVSDPGDVGPLKLSFVEERTTAVSNCSRFF